MIPIPDDCCINVHVTSLLDHWLDWEPPTTSKTHQTPPTSAPLPEANRTTVDQYCKNHKDHCYLQSSQQHSSRRNFHGGLVTPPSEESEGTLSSSSSASSSSSEDEADDDYDDDDEAVIPGRRRRDSHFWQPSDAELESTELPDSRFDLTSLLSRLRTARDPLEMLRTDHCDTSVTRLRDENGNTLLHHVLSGKSASRVMLGKNSATSFQLSRRNLKVVRKYFLYATITILHAFFGWEAVNPCNLDIILYQLKHFSW